jgi:hypothetical protein
MPEAVTLTGTDQWQHPPQVATGIRPRNWTE